MEEIQEKQQSVMLEPAQRAEGFMFFSRRDAQLAVSERKKVDYLEAHMDYSRPETILHIYKKAIDERIFKTPVGIVYLKKLQDYLSEQESVQKEDIPPIVLYQNYDSPVKIQSRPARNRVRPATEDKKPPILPVSIMLNILMVIAIFAMFLISLNTEQPNIINYKRALTDQYSSWEQELTQREQAVREKELELHIQE